MHKGITVMKNEIEFYKYIELLSHVTRFKSNVAMHTNVAAHTFGTLFIAYDLMNKFDLKLDKKHVMEMLLFHDIVEAGMEFDIEAPKAEMDQKLGEYKRTSELKKVKKISKDTGRPYIYDLFVEIEAKETREAKFAKFVDGFEAQNHILNNECKGFNTEEDFDYVLNKLNAPLDEFPELKPYVDEVKSKIVAYKNKVVKKNKKQLA